MAEFAMIFSFELSMNLEMEMTRFSSTRQGSLPPSAWPISDTPLLKGGRPHPNWLYGGHVKVRKTNEGLETPSTKYMNERWAASIQI